MALNAAAFGSGPVELTASRYRARTLPSKEDRAPHSVRALWDLSLDAVAASFAARPVTAGMPPHVLAALSSRLAADLDPRVTMPHIHDEAYWRRACEEGHGWANVDISRHGASWKQVRFGLFVRARARRCEF
jgi:hypothetical protein